jgi:hypothetical protein
MEQVSTSPAPPESNESPKRKKERLETKKLDLEIRDLNRPFWQRLLENPQFITALFTTVAAIVGGWLLISNNYFENRKQELNAEIAASRLEADSSKLEAATAKLEASQSELNAKHSTDDAEIKTKAAKDLIDKANQERTDADEKARQAKVKLDSLSLALASEDVLSKIRSEHAPEQFPMTKLDEARSLAWTAWSKDQSEQARHAVVSTYARPTDLSFGPFGYSGISDANFSSDAKLLITSGNLNGEGLYIWRIPEGKFKHEKDGKPSLEPLEPHPYVKAYDPILSPDERFAVATFQNFKSGDLRIWERAADGFKPFLSPRGFPAADPFPGNLSPHPVFSKEDLLAFEGPDGIVQVLDLLNHGMPVSMRDCQGNPYSRGLKFSPNGRLLAVGYMDGSIHFCDPTTGKDVNEPISPGKHDKTHSSLTDIEFSRDGTRILIANGSPSSEVWNLSTLRHCALQIQNQEPGPFAGKTAFSLDPKSQYVFSIEVVNQGGGFVSQAIAWSGETCEFRTVLEPDGAKDIQLSADGSRAIILTANSMDIFDAHSLEKLSSLEYECGETKAKVSTDGSIVAAWGSCAKEDNAVGHTPIISIYTAVTEKDINRFSPKQ